VLSVPPNLGASVVWSFDTFFLSLSFCLQTFLCLVSASSKICCTPNWGACTYVDLGSLCRSADPAELAATTLASPWKLTVGWQPSASARFPLTSKVGSPYTAVTGTCIIDRIQVPLGKESVFIAQQRRTSRCLREEWKYSVVQCWDCPIRTAVAVPNSKYTYHARLLPYLNQLVPDLTYMNTYIHTYIHTYVRTYIIHTHLLYIQTYIYTYCIYVHTFIIRTYLNAYIHSYIQGVSQLVENYCRR
jgi:hypothetical protein